MSENYCSNDECAEYSTISINNKYYCNDCSPNYELKLIQAYFHGFKIRQAIKPKKFIETKELIQDKLFKYILKSSTNQDFPKQGQIIQAHYTGRLLDGTKFDSSYDRNEPIIFTLGEKQVIQMWDISFATMKKGEKALIIGHPDIAYGDATNSSIIPPNSYLSFTVELIDFYDKPKDISTMDLNEKIENMIQNKNLAKNAYINNDYHKSLELYSKAYEYIINDEHDDKINILNNISLLFSLKSDWYAVINYAQKALALDNNNIKASYRMVQALYNLQDYDDVVRGCIHILSINSDNIPVQNLLKKAKKEVKSQIIKSKKIYQKMFK
tara:strand:- start:1769 stop:2746 length:978 start_codon:yes stop_codon:yes gene_type:complete